MTPASCEAFTYFRVPKTGATFTEPRQITLAKSDNRSGLQLDSSGEAEGPRIAHFLRIQTSHVIGPACLLVMARPATLRASFI